MGEDVNEKSEGEESQTAIVFEVVGRPVSNEM